MAVGLLLALLPVHASAALSADLSIVKTGPATAVAGTNVTYSITTTNNGPNDAANVTTSDTVPTNTTLDALRIAFHCRPVSSQDFLVRGSVIGMMLPTNNIVGAFYRMLSDPPAALDVAVMTPVDRNQPADNRDFAKVRPKSRPESIPRAGEVVRPDHIKDPVPHVTTPVCYFRVGATVCRAPASGWRGGWYRYPTVRLDVVRE
jgi:uncharacterized repeat protein (TIGR01451 family)